MADEWVIVVEYVALFPLLLALVLIALGHIAIRALGFHLPAPRNFSDFIFSAFWIYPPSVSRERIIANKIAWFVVVVVAYLITISVF